jgi:hypothetical protein
LSNRNNKVCEILTAVEVELQAFLKSLPMTLVSDGLCFTHSLPYDSVRSFYEPVDDVKTPHVLWSFFY